MLDRAFLCLAGLLVHVFFFDINLNTLAIFVHSIIAIQRIADAIPLGFQKIVGTVGIQIGLRADQIGFRLSHPYCIRFRPQFHTLSSNRTGLIASSYQFFQTQSIEIHQKIPDKIALCGVVAITEYNFPMELICIIVQLIPNFRQLRIELIILRSFRRAQIRICHHDPSLSPVIHEYAAATHLTPSCHAQQHTL